MYKCDTLEHTQTANIQTHTYKTTTTIYYIFHREI